MIQRNLNEDINNLCHWFKENELIINLKKGKTESVLFGTSKRVNPLQGKELSIFVNGTYINTTFSYKYLGIDLDPNLNLSLHFDRIHKKAAGRVNLLKSICPSLDQECGKNLQNYDLA